MSGIGRYLSLVKFEHTIFALPFALLSLLVAADGRPSPTVLLWVVVAMVGARTAAMAFNRLADRELDARNPRTADRHLPAGLMRADEVAGLVAVSVAVFCAAAWRLNPLCLALSPVALAVILGYSYTKRFTAGSHLVLGLALGIAPVGAWLAVTGRFAAFPLWTAAGVLFWVAGFDTIYACQDEDHDRRAGLHSLAARLGARRALLLARVFHVVAVACFWIAFSLPPSLGPVSLLGLIIMVALLMWEHHLVRDADLAHIDKAFFTINSWIGILLLTAVVLDLYLI